MEIWKTINGTRYGASNFGEVKNLDTNKKIKTHKCSKGYLRVGLYVEGKRKRFAVHRLVAENFLTNKKGKPQVDHINRIKTDNRVDNLRWVTALENNNNRDKIKKDKVKEIIDLYKNGKTVEEIHKEINQ